MHGERRNGDRNGNGRRPPINIQDSFLFGNLKEGRDVAVMLITGKALVGRIARFDRFAVIFEIGGDEQMVYKHGILSIGDVPAAARRQPPLRARPGARAGQRQAV